MLAFRENMKVLFIGDSITDCGRSRNSDRLLGDGYVGITTELLNKEYTDLHLNFINRGISGNRVRDLKARWQEDCIGLAPDIVSILIGINDVWRRYSTNDPTSPDAFAEDYKNLLEAVKSELSAQIIIIEPFVLPFPEDRKQWRDDLDPKIGVTRELAIEFADAYVPMDGIFASASCVREPSFWAGDGVHPSQAGHMLIARSWLTAAFGKTPLFPG